MQSVVAQWGEVMRARNSTGSLFSFCLTAIGLTAGALVFAGSGQAQIGQLTAGQAGALPFDQREFNIGFSDPVRIAEAQHLLSRLGLNPGQTEGVIDIQTFNSVRDFQTRVNVAVTGIVDQSLVDQMQTVLANLPATGRNATPTPVVGGFSQAPVIGGFSNGTGAAPVEIDVGGLGQTSFLGAVGTLSNGGHPNTGNTMTHSGNAHPVSPNLRQTNIAPQLVREVQIHLNELGFGPIVSDGNFGPRTAQSIVLFQASVGWPRSGQLTSQLLHTLRQIRGGPTPNASFNPNAGFSGAAGSSPPGTRIYRRTTRQEGYGGNETQTRNTLSRSQSSLRNPRQAAGRNGVMQPRDIFQTQQMLAYLGYDVGEIDGVYGPRTARSIEEYQHGAGLNGDGRITSAFLSGLRERVRANGGSQFAEQFDGRRTEDAGRNRNYNRTVTHSELIIQGGPGFTSGIPQAGYTLVPVVPGLPTGPSVQAPMHHDRHVGDPNMVPLAGVNDPRRAPFQAGAASVAIPGPAFGQLPGQQFPGQFPGQFVVPPLVSAPPTISGGIGAAGPAVRQNLLADGAPVPLAAPIAPVTVAPMPAGQQTQSASDQNVVSLQDLVSGRVTLDANGNPIAGGGIGVPLTSSQDAAVVSGNSVEIAGYTSGLVLEAFKLSQSGEREFLGKIFDTSPMPFGYDTFLRDPGLSPYRSEGRIGLLWSGGLNIEQSGTHRVALEGILTRAIQCDVELLINGVSVVQFSTSQTGAIREDASMDLTAGPVPFSLFFSCDETLPTAQSYAQVSIVGPNNRSDGPLAANRLFAKNPFLQ